MLFLCTSFGAPNNKIFDSRYYQRIELDKRVWFSLSRDPNVTRCSFSGHVLASIFSDVVDGIILVSFESSFKHLGCICFLRRIVDIQFLTETALKH
jgi:hypothetical protein